MIAGGQSLVPMMMLRMAAPTALVDVGGAAERTIEVRDGTLELSALVRHVDLEHSDTVAACCPMLTEAVPPHRQRPGAPAGDDRGLAGPCRGDQRAGLRDAGPPGIGPGARPGRRADRRRRGPGDHSPDDDARSRRGDHRRPAPGPDRAPGVVLSWRWRGAPATSRWSKWRRSSGSTAAAGARRRGSSWVPSATRRSMCRRPRPELVGGELTEAAMRRGRPRGGRRHRDRAELARGRGLPARDGCGARRPRAARGRRASRRRAPETNGHRR